jgi:multidrug transporter EmrE-like cation transporter
MRLSFNFLFIILSILSQACGGICGKYASMTINNSPISIVLSPFYFAALGFMVLQAIFWQQALKHYPLSFAYPFISLVNFVVLFSAFFLFGEAITIYNILGLIIISIGIFMLARERNAPT